MSPVTNTPGGAAFAAGGATAISAASAARVDKLLLSDIGVLLQLSSGLTRGRRRLGTRSAVHANSWGLGGGQACLLWESRMVTRASAVLSAASTGLTTGTPMRSPRRAVISDRKSTRLNSSHLGTS